MKPTETLYYWKVQERLEKQAWNGHCSKRTREMIQAFPFWERIWFCITNKGF